MLRPLILASLVHFPLFAANHYIDPQQGSDAVSRSTPSAPWKSTAKLRGVALAAGDSVLFRRGTSGTDSLTITANGQEKRPVVVSSYGDPGLPPALLRSTGNLILVRKSKYLVIENLTLTGARAACVDLSDTTNQSIVVQGIEAYDCGGGVYVSGKNIVVRNNHIHDGHMVVNTKNTKDDDYGASGVNFTNVNGCQVYGNRFENLKAPSFDYGVDGGAFEFWRSARNCDIYGNFALDVDGFSEFGGQLGDSVVNVRIHHNVAIDGVLLGCFHIAGAGALFGIGFDGLRLDHNLMVKRKEGNHGFYLVADGGSHTPASRIQIRNNILVSDSMTYFAYVAPTDSKTAPFLNRNNLVWSPKLNPFKDSWKAGVGDRFADPLFMDSAWTRTIPTDTALRGFELGRKSPATGTAENLGYLSDFFGNPYQRGNVVDIGPFSLGSKPLPPGKNRGSNPFRLITRHVGGRLELEIEMESAATLDARLLSVDGRSLFRFPIWSVESGQSIHRLALPPSFGSTRILQVTAEGQEPQYEKIGLWSQRSGAAK
ncbi:MAG: right-handed parallel beta-helix repeat-containing protein [Fibrobacteres bacterium]|nr:right-handed parallel beta-helix repeat-containing protein [Fibrobacterota bacterium]